MAARNMIPSSSTRNLLFSSFRDHRRLLSSSSSSSKSNPPNWPPPVRESYLTFEKQDIDIGRWVFRINARYSPELQRFSENDLYKFIIKAVGESIGSESEAQKRIYFVATPRLGFFRKIDFGFGGYFDIETRDKIVKDVEFVVNSTQDIYYETRENHPTTRQLSLQ